MLTMGDWLKAVPVQALSLHLRDAKYRISQFSATLAHVWPVGLTVTSLVTTPVGCGAQGELTMLSLSAVKVPASKFLTSPAKD